MTSVARAFAIPPAISTMAANKQTNHGSARRRLSSVLVSLSTGHAPQPRPAAAAEAAAQPQPTLLEDLRRRKADALAEEDFMGAYQCHQALAVLTPGQPPEPPGAGASVQEQVGRSVGL